MIRILMKDGTVLENDSRLGLNLSTVEEIVDCLAECKYYRLVTKSSVLHIMSRDEVQSVYEDNETQKEES